MEGLPKKRFICLLHIIQMSFQACGVRRKSSTAASKMGQPNTVTLWPCPVAQSIFVLVHHAAGTIQRVARNCERSPCLPTNRGRWMSFCLILDGRNISGQGSHDAFASQ